MRLEPKHSYPSPRILRVVDNVWYSILAQKTHRILKSTAGNGYYREQLGNNGSAFLPTTGECSKPCCSQPTDCPNSHKFFNLSATGIRQWLPMLRV